MAFFRVIAAAAPHHHPALETSAAADFATLWISDAHQLPTRQAEALVHSFINRFRLSTGTTRSKADRRAPAYHGRRKALISIAKAPAGRAHAHGENVPRQGEGMSNAEKDDLADKFASLKEPASR